MVTAVAYTNFRKDLKSYLRRVNDDADMLLVTNKDGLMTRGTITCIGRFRIRKPSSGSTR